MYAPGIVYIYITALDRAPLREQRNTSGKRVSTPVGSPSRPAVGETKAKLEGIIAGNTPRQSAFRRSKPLSSPNTVRKTGRR